MARNDVLQTGELTDTYYYMMLSLVEAKHGYLIMKTVEELTGGDFIIGPASLYTSIKKLLSAGMIEQLASEKEKKTYILTEQGMSLLKKDIKRREKMVDQAKVILQKKGEVI